MLIYSGGQDKLFPAEAVNDAFAKVHKVWASQNAQDKLETKTWPELGHVFNQQQQDEVFPGLPCGSNPEPERGHFALRKTCRQRLS